MEGESSSGRQAVLASPADQRRDARFKVNSSATHTVKVILGHAELNMDCVDYSPFGLGLRVRVSPDLPLLSIGELVDLDCDFAGSRFRARGSVANTRVERTGDGDFVRLGIVLSRSAEVVRPAHIKRRSARIQMNESLSPMVMVSDELRFGAPIFAKLTDVSQGGMRLVIDRHPLPFLEKQRHWFEILLPAFGHCRVFCRIAYVRRDGQSSRYVVGCEFIDGGEEDRRLILEDWLFYCNFWLQIDDIRSAGFELKHLSSADERYRVLLSAVSYSYTSNSSDQSENESTVGEGQVTASSWSERFEITVGSGTDVLRMSAAFSEREQLLLIESIESHNAPFLAVCSVWKALVVFASTHQIVDLDIAAGQTLTDFVRVSFGSGEQDGKMINFKVDDLLAGDELDWRIWRRIYKDVRRKSSIKLPEPDSFFRKVLLI